MQQIASLDRRRGNALVGRHVGLHTPSLDFVLRRLLEAHLEVVTTVARESLAVRTYQDTASQTTYHWGV
jgi:hypothetical protein